MALFPYRVIEVYRNRVRIECLQFNGDPVAIEDYVSYMITIDQLTPLIPQYYHYIPGSETGGAY